MQQLTTEDMCAWATILINKYGIAWPIQEDDNDDNDYDAVN